MSRGPIQVQLRHNKDIYSSKKEALASITSYVNSHVLEFKDGEIIVLRYYDDNKNVISANGIIHIVDSNATVSIGIEDSETVKIIESSGEPSDTSSIWLDNSDNTDDIAEIKYNLEALYAEVNALKELVNKHEFAFDSVLDSGDIYNSSKATLENSDTKESVISGGTTEEAATDFDVYIGAKPLSDRTLSMYEGTIYETVVKYTPETACDTYNPVTLYSSNEDIIEVLENNRLYVRDSGSTQITATMINATGETIVKEYPLSVTTQQKPDDYDEYQTPNIKHILIKTAPTYAELLAAAINGYILNNELAYCQGDKYLYIIQKNRPVQIGSGGGGGDTGETSDNIVFVDDDGILTIVGDGYSIDENGNLVITDTEVTIDENGTINLITD